LQRKIFSIIQYSMFNFKINRKHYNYRSFNAVCFLQIAFSFLFTSCTTSDLYEKHVSLADHEWKAAYKPEFDFIIKDTTSLYKVFFVIRHTEKYNYKNIWINLYSQPPGDTLHKAQYELTLATNDKGWLATGMDDIYEHRKELTKPVRLKPGTYKLILENIMREDPLQHILNVGIRIEKIK
jgi:gliding motility-associated lipoprotein GldH